MMTVSHIPRLIGIDRGAIYFYERSALIRPPQRSRFGDLLFSEEVNRLFGCLLSLLIIFCEKIGKRKILGWLNYHDRT